MKTRIEEEKEVVQLMVELYCRRKEGHETLCPGCRELLAYAQKRLEHCRFGETKPTCEYCPVHCYRRDMRERIRQVMRWSGPRMLLYHPVAAVRHLRRNLISRYPSR